MTVDPLFPILVYQDRYEGNYSGGKWIAIANAMHVCEEDRDTSRFGYVHEQAWGGDPDALNFWLNPPKWVAVGDTAQEALDKLRAEKKDNG